MVALSKTGIEITGKVPENGGDDGYGSEVLPQGLADNDL